MMKSCPNPIDNQELQFKLHCRFKIFETVNNEQFSKAHSLTACASRFGLLFVGTSSSRIQVIQLKCVENFTPKNKDVREYPRRTVDLPSAPQHLSVNCDSTVLAVVIENSSCAAVLFYEVQSFLKESINLIKEIRLSPTPGVEAVEINWNPSIPSIFTACKSDGSLGLFELKGTTVDINELPSAAGATCFCWSPKGKQIAVGSKEGKITQYKPDLKAVKVINTPPFQGPHSMVSLQWVSNYQFIGVYQPNEPEAQTNLIVVDAPKTGETSYTNYDDVCYSSGSVRQTQFYMKCIQQWNLLLVASSNSTEVGVLSNTSDLWTQWIIGDAARAELPLSQNHQETLPIGLELDVSSTRPIIWGETTLPPAPLLIMLSHHGVLCLFDVLNLKPGVPHICSAPEPVSDTNGLKYFISKSDDSVSPQISVNIAGFQAAVEEVNIKPTPQRQLSVNQPATSQAPPSFGSPFPFGGTSSQSDTVHGIQPPVSYPSSALSQILPKTSTSSLALYGEQSVLTLQNSIPSTTASKYSSIFSALNAPEKPLFTSSTSASSVFSPQPAVTKSVTSSASIFSPVSVTSKPTSGFAPLPSATKPATLTPQVFPSQSSLTKSSSSVTSTVTKASSLSIQSKPQIATPPTSNSNLITNKSSMGRSITVGESKSSIANEVSLTKMIRDECLSLESELKILLHQGTTLKIKLGTDQEKHELVSNIDSLQEFLKELIDISVGQNTEVHTLKQNLIQSWAWFEEARSRYNASKDETMSIIVKAQPLDSASEKQLKDIRHLMYYLESQLTQASKALDEQWDNFQNYAKKVHKIETPTMEKIFKTMVGQNAVLQKQSYILKDISNRLRRKARAVNNPSLLVTVSNANNLEEQLDSLQLEPQDICQYQYEKVLNRAKCMSKEKTDKMRKLLKNRDVTAVKPQLSISTMQSPVGKNKKLLSILGAQMSPVTKTSSAKSLNFIQSTPIKDNKNAEACETPPSTPADAPHIKFTYKNSEKPAPLFSAQPVTSNTFLPVSKSGSLFNTIQTSSSSNTVSAFAPTIQNKPAAIRTASIATPTFTQNSLATKHTTNKAETGMKALFSPTVTIPVSVETPSKFTFGSNLAATNASPSQGNIFSGKASVFTGLSAAPSNKSSLYPDLTPFSSNSGSRPSTTKSVFGNAEGSLFNKAEQSAGVTATETPRLYPNLQLAGSSSESSKSSLATVESSVSSSTDQNAAFVKPLFNFGGTASQTSFFGKPTVDSKIPISTITSTPSLVAESKVTSTKPEVKVTAAGISSTQSFSAPPLDLTKPLSTGGLFGKSTVVTTTQSTGFSFGSQGSGPVLASASSLTPLVSSANISSKTVANSVLGTNVISSSFPQTPLIQGTKVATDVKSSENNIASTTSADPADVKTTQSTTSLFGLLTSGAKPSILGNTSTTSAPTSAFTPISSNTPPQNSVFSPSTTTVQSSIFSGFAAKASASSVATATPTTAPPPVFGTSMTPAASVAAATPTTLPPPVFGAQILPTTISSPAVANIASTTSPLSMFGSKSPSVTTSSVFGTMAPSATSSSIFGTAASATSSVFGAASLATTTSSSPFGTSASTVSGVANFGSGGSIFKSGNATTSSNVFATNATVTTQASSIFGSQPSSANVTIPLTSVFGSTTSSTTPIFGSATGATPPFGSTFSGTTTSSTSPFGQQTSVFGTPKTTNSVFGGTTFGTSPSTIFGAPQTTSTNVFGSTPTCSSAFGSGSSIFGAPSTNASSPFSTSGNIFGSSTSQPSSFSFATGPVSTTNASSFGFGGLSVGAASTTTSSNIFGTSTFGQTTASNPFAKPSSEDQKSTFGTGGSIFGNTNSSGFGSTNSSIFNTNAQGFGGSSTFGSSPAFGQPSAFGQGTFGTSTFGSPQPGPFSGGASTSVSQSGFGSPSSFQKPSGFGATPSFGGSAAFGASPSFGGAPTFGSAPVFGSPNKIFGSSSPTGTFGNTESQQSPTFGNLAHQNTLGFGNLAQQAATPPQATPFSGNSSFSSWR